MSLDIERMRSKLESESKSYKNANYDKLVDGKNVRRVLWPKDNGEEFWAEGYVHYNLGPEGNKIATCLKTFDSKARCPICEYAEKLKNSKNKEEKKLADSLKARRRILIAVLNRDSDEEEEPKVLPIGVSILKGLLETICDPDYGDITDFSEGRDMTIKKSGKGLNTEYSVLPKPKSSIASEEFTKEELEEKIPDLMSLFVEKSPEELEAILNGEDEEKEEDEDDKSDDEYDDLDLEELQELCRKRKISFPVKSSRLKLIALLTDNDKKKSRYDDDEEEEDEDDSDNKSDDDDALQDEIQQALQKRKTNKR